MSGGVSQLDLVGGFDLFPHGISILILLSVLFVFFALKQLTGSYSIFQVMKDYKDKKRQDERYTSLFNTRDNLLYHIGASRSRGESVEQMVNELRSVDAAITLMEEKMAQTKQNI